MSKIMGKLWEKKNSKKGFTLVELIVVLVILAILMAILIPAMSGWIDKAKNRQIQLEARNVEMAAQAGLYEQFGQATGGLTEVTSLADVSGSIVSEYVNDACGSSWGTDVITCQMTYNVKGEIQKFTYTKGGKIATYTPEGWSVSTTS